MLVAYNESIPKELKAGEWHIPFGESFDVVRLGKVQQELGLERKVVRTEGNVDYIDLSDIKVKIATARCARVSYLNFEGKDDYNNDIRLFDTLLGSGHMSPFEHCARAMSRNEHALNVSGTGIMDSWSMSNEVFYPIEAHGWSGNFKGFIQLRKTLPNENQSDSRVLRK